MFLLSYNVSVSQTNFLAAPSVPRIYFSLTFTHRGCDSLWTLLSGDHPMDGFRTGKLRRKLFVFYLLFLLSLSVFICNTGWWG